MTTILREQNTNINDILPKALYQEGNPMTDDLLAPTNSLLQGAVTRTSTEAGRTATVKAGEDIRPALNSLKSAGGGTLILLSGVHKPTYDIVGFSGLNIIGEGSGLTTIDFGNNDYQVNFMGLASNYLEAISVKSLTITNSSASDGALRLHYINGGTFEDIVVTDSVVGVETFALRYASYTNCDFSRNSSHGYYVYGQFGSVGTQTGLTLFLNTSFDENGGGGYTQASISASNIRLNTFLNCRFVSNAGNGFTYYGFLTNLVSCYLNDNGGDGLYINGDAINISACSSIYNYANGINVDANADDVSIFSGVYLGNGITAGNDVVVDDGANGVSVVGVSTSSNILSDESPSNISTNCAYGLVSKKDVIIMINRSGSTIAAGAPVILDPTLAATAGEVDKAISATTTAGDDRVIGMALASISNTSTGPILLVGSTTLLKVDGTTDIAVGDFLCTYSVAGIAAKATAGDMAFAIALEAYTTNDSNGVIDALIISPRKL